MEKIHIRSALEGLNSYGIETGAPFLIKFGRVPIEDEVSEITGAEVVVLLIGERPGLATAESMSAYIAYKAAVGMDEARRTVISNIHKNGTPAIEAGAYIADIVKTMLEKKASGLDLRIVGRKGHLDERRYDQSKYSFGKDNIQCQHDLAQQLGLLENESIGLVTSDSDDVTYVALDEATKKANVRVVYAKSLYAGASNASTKLARRNYRGHCRGNSCRSKKRS